MRVLGKIFRYFPFSVKCKFVDILLKKDGIEIKEAKTQEELEQVYRLRFKVYKDEDYIEPQDYPAQMMKDDYDENAINFLAMIKNKRPIGTVRLIFYSKNGFSLEHAFNILNFPFPKEETADLSKLCVKKEFRNGFVSLGLLKKALQFSKIKNIKCWFFGTTEEIKNNFEERLGSICYLLPVGPLTPENLRERNLAAKKYFQKAQIIPYFIDIEKIKI